MNYVENEDHECGTDGKSLMVACEDGFLRAVDVRNRQQVGTISELHI